MFDEVQTLAKTVDAEKLAKVKEYMLKNVDDQAKTNNYWVRQLNRLRKYGVDTHTDYKKVVEAQTPADIAAFMQQLLKADNFARIVMTPAE